jgi:radical SAM-linked protein
MTTALQTVTPIAANATAFSQFLTHTLMPKVFKPGRYLGLEQGAFRKPWDSVQGRMALAFPDVYEIGASSYAIKLLYSVVNQVPGLLCDRVYAPAQDMRDLLKEHALPLFGVETQRPLADFDMIAVSLQYELNYTTVLGMLESAQIPLRSANRTKDHWPIILGGGPGATQPNPVLPFFDGFMIGDGEDVLVEALQSLAQARELGLSRHERLTRLATIDGVLVPGYNDYVEKRIVDLGSRSFDIAPLIPAVEAIHDRVVVEARRGCDRMCRFCQPAFINLPARENSVEKIKTELLKQINETGYEECSLLSLSIADYSQFKHLVTDVSKTLKENNASLSLSSQRADRFSVEVAEAVQSVRKSTLTFAPEAGTGRLRDVINKNLSDTDILNAVTSAYRAGWNKVKLYYMIGLPTETQADLDGIVSMVQKLRGACGIINRSDTLSKRQHLEVNLTISNFVPKPHTPFQWHAQDTMDNLKEKITYLRSAFKGMKGVKVNYTTPSISKLEAVISRGGPELADALELAYHNGAYLDAWDENQPFSKWFEALTACGIDVEAYTRARFTHPSDPLPWDHINVGLEKDWLTTEWERSLKAASTTPCFEQCSVCGVCSQFNVWPSFTQPGDQLDTIAPSTTSPSALATADFEESLGNEPIVTLPEPEKEGRPDFVAPVGRLRLSATKLDNMRFISHLDWMRMIQRALKRADVPMAVSAGFNPKPRVSFSPALPLFVAAHAEWIDVWLSEPVDASSTLAKINLYLPPECQITSAAEYPLLAPSVDAQITAMTYRAEWPTDEPVDREAMAQRLALLADASVPVIFTAVATQKGKEDKVVTLNQGLSGLRLTDQAAHFTVSPVEGRWVKPSWITQFLAPDLPWVIHRETLVLADDTIIATV